MVEKRRLEDEHDKRMVMAWTIEALHRQKRLPDVKTLFVKREVTQSVKQMRTVVQLISEAYRIPLKTKKKKKR